MKHRRKGVAAIEPAFHSSILFRVITLRALIPGSPITEAQILRVQHVRNCSLCAILMIIDGLWM